MKPAGLEEYNVLTGICLRAECTGTDSREPPRCLVYQGFDYLEYNRERQRNRELVKSGSRKEYRSFQEEDMELFAGLTGNPEAG